MRQIPEVIAAIIEVLLEYNLQGLAVQPIPAMADPQDEIQGDYAIHCNLSVPTLPGMDESKRYMALYEASIIMFRWCHMEEERFDANLGFLRESISEFIEQSQSGKGEVRVVTSNGVFDYGALRRKADRGSVQ